MDALAKATPESCEQARTVVAGYGAVLVEQPGLGCGLPAHLQEPAEVDAVGSQTGPPTSADGLDHVATNEAGPQVLPGSMNGVMRDQRVASQVAGGTGVRLIGHDRAATAGSRSKEGAEAASWYPFQLAFILMQLPL